MEGVLRKQFLPEEDHKQMSMKTKAAVLVTSFAVLLFVVVGSMGGVHASSNDGAYRQLQVYSEVLSRVRSEYVEEPNIPKVTDGALHGLLESLDSNSSYLTPEAYKAFKDHKAEGKAGIGRDLQALWLCRCSFCPTRFAGGESRNRIHRHLRVD
jgi:hypothetical protein